MPLSAEMIVPVRIGRHFLKVVFLRLPMPTKMKNGTVPVLLYETGTYYTYSNVEVSDIDISQILSIFNLSKNGRLYSDKRFFISIFQNVF